ncbi:MAG: PDZ domain-containing protein [Planctomycetes bacterium]|nr:PDZ domain-containing protein [Planctomycetota bacterium]
MNRWLKQAAVVTFALSTSLAFAAPPPPPEGGPQDGPPPRDGRPPRGPEDGRGGPGGPGHDHDGPPRQREVTYLGIATGPLPAPLAAQLKLPEGTGLLVEYVEDGSPAAAAGIARFDVLQKLGDQLLVNPEQLRTLIQSHKEGQDVKLTIIHAGEAKDVSAKLAKKMIEDRPPMQMFGPGGGPEGRGPGGQGPDGRGRDGHDGHDGHGAPGAPGGPGMDHRMMGPGMMPMNPEMRNKMLDEMRDRLRESGLSREQVDRIIERMQNQMGNMRGPGMMRGGADGGRPGDDHARHEHGGPGDSVIGVQSMSLSYSDDDHTLSITVNDGKRSLVAKDKAGKVLFDGPINTEEERAKIPAEVRDKVNRLERQAHISVHVDGEGDRHEHPRDGQRPDGPPDREGPPPPPRGDGPPPAL